VPRARCGECGDGAPWRRGLAAPTTVLLSMTAGCRRFRRVGASRRADRRWFSALSRGRGPSERSHRARLAGPGRPRDHHGNKRSTICRFGWPASQERQYFRDWRTHFRDCA
jgi:hypothetical protein